MIYHKINIENVIFFYSKKMSHSKLNRDLHYYKNIGKKFKKRLMSTCKNYIRYYSYIYIINSFCLLVPYFLECFRMLWSHYLFRKKLKRIQNFLNIYDLHDTYCLNFSEFDDNPHILFSLRKFY